MSHVASNKWSAVCVCVCVCVWRVLVWKCYQGVSPFQRGWPRVVSAEAWWLVGTWLIEARCYPAFLCYLGGDDLGDGGAVFLWIWTSQSLTTWSQLQSSSQPWSRQGGSRPEESVLQFCSTQYKTIKSFCNRIVGQMIAILTNMKECKR